MTEVKKLYGGAVMAYIPPHACDISKLRQVPDNQEVFAHSSSDQSIIFDILQHADGASDQEAARIHFEELVGDSTGQAQLKNITKLDLNLPNCDGVFYINGEHYVSKYKEQAKNLVELHIALFRYKNFETDILVTFNDPISINPESSSYEGSNAVTKWTKEQFMKTIQTFSILDFGLFC